MPLVGASAGISALMGAASRFVFQSPPHLSLHPWQLPPRMPLPTLGELVRDRRAMAFVGVCLATMLLSSGFVLPLSVSGEPIAWDAHLGGFVVGFVLPPLLEPAARI